MSSFFCGEGGTATKLVSTVRELEDGVSDLSSRQLQTESQTRSLEERLDNLEQLVRRSLKDTHKDGPALLSASSREQLEARREAGASDDLIRYHLGGTLWEAPAFIGLKQLGRGPSVIMTVSMLLNIGIQIFLVVNLLQSEDFNDGRPYENLREPMRQWRMTTGHSHAHVDATGMSLASRVCNKDPSLNSAQRQVQLLKEIDGYLGRPEPEEWGYPTGSGPMLCLVCTVFFAILVFRELRSISILTEAILAVPRGHTRIEDWSFEQISTLRLAIVLLVNLLRGVVALALLYVGVKWLATTTSVTELILNAAALGFVLDLDEVLFETVAPGRAHLLLQGLKPLKHRARRCSLEAIAPLLAVVATAIFVTQIWLFPNIDDMRHVRLELCGPQLDFTSGVNPAGYATSRNTVSFSAQGPELGLLGVVNEELKQRLIFNPEVNRSTLEFSSFENDASSFNQFLTHSMSDIAGETDCIDYDAGFYAAAFTWKVASLRFQIGENAGKSTREVPFNCGDVARHCQISDMVRNSCPITCGCDNPLSGLAFSSARGGCPVPCEGIRRSRIVDDPCENRDVRGVPGWQAYWQVLRALVSVGADQQQETEWDTFIDGKLREGCNNTDPPPLGVDINFCDESQALLKQNGITSVASFCPATCCRDHVAVTSPDCPAACSSR